MAFIFLQSALSADLSQAESGLITEWLAGLLKADPEVVSFVVRKCAHFAEYFALGISLSYTVREFARLRAVKRRRKAALQSEVSESGSVSELEGEDFAQIEVAVRQDVSGSFLTGLIAWGIGTLYAVSDEIHQMFIDGRSCELRDIAIDAGGVFLGVLVIHLIWRAHHRRKQNN